MKPITDAAWCVAANTLHFALFLTGLACLWQAARLA